MKLSAAERGELLKLLNVRFHKNPSRHKGVEWAKVEARLKKEPDKLWSLNEMEKTGGEPDVIAFDKKTKEYIFCDCSSEIIFFVIVLRKLQRGAEVFVMIMKHWNPVRSTNLPTVRCKWLLIWE